MKTLSATCLAIACALKDGTLRVTESQGRFGQFFVIGDDYGMIEVAMSREELDARLGDIKQRIA